jgi:hypothetical protein
MTQIISYKHYYFCPKGSLVPPPTWATTNNRCVLECITNKSCVLFDKQEHAWNCRGYQFVCFNDSLVSTEFVCFNKIVTSILASPDEYAVGGVTWMHELNLTERAPLMKGVSCIRHMLILDTNICG